MDDEMNLPTFAALFFLGLIIFGLPLMIVMSIMYPSEFDTWAKEKDKLCWEKGGDFKVSKYGMRCTKNGAVLIIFNETFRPKETTK